MREDEPCTLGLMRSVELRLTTQLRSKFTADSQSKSCTAIDGVQFLETTEDALSLLWRNALTCICH